MGDCEASAGGVQSLSSFRLEVLFGGNPNAFARCILDNVVSIYGRMFIIFGECG